MKQYKTEGIIIKRHNFGEADRMLTIYSSEYGIIKAIAKGARRIQSKLGGHIELFYVNDFVIHKGRNIDIVTSVQMKQRFAKLEDTKQLINYAYAMAELMYLTANEHEENRDIYEMIKIYLSELNINNKVRIFTLFELKLYDHLGFGAKLDKCNMCRDELVSNNVFFNFNKGGSLCLQCAGNNINSLKITDNAYKILKLSKKIDLVTLLKINITGRDYKDLEKCAIQMRHEIIERELKSLN